MKTIYFLDDFDISLEQELKGQEVISLDPGISYALEERGVRYRIPEDYYDEKALRSNEHAYFLDQLEWFDRLDSFIKAHISYCREHNILFARANYLRLKYVIDTTVIYARIIDQILAANPEVRQIVYIRKPSHDPARCSIFEFRLKHRDIFWDVVHSLSGKHARVFTERIVRTVDAVHQNYAVPLAPWRQYAKSQLKKISTFFVYDKADSLFQPQGTIRDIGVFLLHAGSPDIDIPIRELIRRKARVFVREDNRMIREDTISRRAVELPPLEKDFTRVLTEECARCGDALADHQETFEWINSRCGFDASEIMKPFLKDFASNDAAFILRDAERMHRFYKDHDIRYVFARGNTDRNAVGPLLAAKYTEEVKSIGIQHASFAVDMEALGIFETETYDYTLARDRIAEDYFKALSKGPRADSCAVFQSPHYARYIASHFKGKSHKKRLRERIVYVEKKFAATIRSFNNMIYPLTWYYEFQKRLIDLFANQDRFDFVYKHSAGQLWAEASLVKYMQKKRRSNVTLFKGHFLKLLSSTDRVIVDYPSSALFEAALSGKPVLCVYADYFNIIPQARKVFGKMLRPFSSVDEAISIIQDFLEGDPDDYILKENIFHGDFIGAFRCIVKDGVRDD